MRTNMTASMITVATLMWGCGGSVEHTVREDLATARRAHADREPVLDGSLASYLAYAAHNSPELRASYQRWRAEVERVAPNRRWPDPVLSYAYYARSVETRVGPQRHRFGVRQSIPWPTRVTAGGEAAANRARAAQRRFEADRLALRQRVAEAYYRLWVILNTHRLLLSQDEVLEGLEASVRARVEIGRASLADLSRVRLHIERHHDHRFRHAEEARAARAALRAAIGAPRREPISATEAPGDGRLPAEGEETLRRDAFAHPMITAHESLAEASEAAAIQSAAGGLPSFTLGVDYIETGEASAAGVQDSGKDPIIVSLSMSLPLWRGTYDDAEEAAHAEGQAHRADQEAARRRAAAALEAAMSSVRDTERRIRLYRDTLVPQAETIYISMLGGYATTGASLSDVLLAVNDLLDLQTEVVVAEAEHAVAWARLEAVVGRPVTTRDGGES